MSDVVDGLGGLNVQEQLVMQDLISAWNRFAALPGVHPDHRADFRRALHEQQRILAVRAATRACPDYWGPNVEFRS